MSLERSLQFHQVRRILKTVAPDYRILANPGLNQGFSAIDLSKKTIEISESEGTIETAVPSLLFQIGHAIWHRHNGFEENLSKEDYSHQNEMIDQFASEWATKVLTMYFHFDSDKARKQVTQLVWSYKDWVFYFSE